MSKLPRYRTAYSEYVFSNVVKMVEGQGKAYTVIDLALLVGLKPTNNFKRRVNQMVYEGLISKYPAFSPKGGLMHMYTSSAIGTPFEEEIQF